MLQGGSTTFKAMQLLRSQPGFWSAIVACVPESLQRTLELDDDAQNPVEFWSRRIDVAWKLASEAAALQLLALEAYRNPQSRPRVFPSHSFAKSVISGMHRKQLV